MAQPPDSNRIRLKFRNVFIGFAIVALLVLILYVVYLEVGENYAWSILFLVLLNVYLVYRVGIRNRVRESLLGEDKSRSSSTRLDTPNIIKEKSGNEIFAMYDETYDTCRNCKSKLIPDLDYCESCGHPI